MPIDVTGLVNASMPAIIALLQRRHAEENPGAPALTDEQARAGLQAAVAASLAKDDEDAADIRKRNPWA